MALGSCKIVKKITIVEKFEEYHEIYNGLSIKHGVSASAIGH